MKKLLLILLLSPMLCFAGGHTENHNGTLYWVNDDGTWYYKGPAHHALTAKSPQRSVAQKKQDNFAAWFATLSLEGQASVLKDLEQNERDQVMRDIEMDLSNIAVSLER